MINMKDLEIFVLTTHHRPAIITDYLKDIPHHVYYNPDHNWEPGLPLNEKLLSMAWNRLNAYRIFRGNANICQMAKTKYTLIFEDDARPNRDDWLQIALHTDEILNDAECASLHGRDFWPRDPDYITNPGIIDKIIQYKDEELVFTKIDRMPNDEFDRVWCLGSCMAYVLNEDGRQKIINYKYDGLPMDFIVPGKLDFYVLRKSCFEHDRKHGTLMG